MSARAERRRQLRASQRYPITVSAFKPGDPANEQRLAAIEADRESMLNDPEISPELRESLQKSLHGVRFTRLMLAAIEAPEPEAMH